MYIFHFINKKCALMGQKENKHTHIYMGFFVEHIHYFFINICFVDFIDVSIS